MLFASDMQLHAVEARALDEGRTVSELLFQDVICEQAQIGCSRIDEEPNARSPDYRLDVDGQVIIAEVKEIGMNKQDRQAAEQMAKHGYGGVGGTVGDRVRHKINKSGPQIRARTEGRYPGMLVLYDTTGHGWLDPVQIEAAMYGPLTLELAVPQDPSIKPYKVRDKFGPGRKMTPNANTSVSAIGAIIRSGYEDWNFNLVVYHNAHAAIPIDPALLDRHGIRQATMNFATMRWMYRATHQGVSSDG